MGFVSRAHIFPCEELVYRPLDPPVRQTLHLRYPLGHTLTAPESYLAGLLVEERLADPRYQPADTPFVQQLLDDVRTPAGAVLPKSAASCTVGTALQTVQEVNLDTRVLEYLIAIVEEHSLSKQRTGSCWHSPPSPAICTTWRPWWGCRCFPASTTGCTPPVQASSLPTMPATSSAWKRSCSPGSAPAIPGLPRSDLPPSQKTNSRRAIRLHGGCLRILRDQAAVRASPSGKMILLTKKKITMEMPPLSTVVPML